MRDGFGSSLRGGRRFATATFLAAVLPVAAQAAEQRVAVDIKAGPLEAALVAYSLQTHRQLLYAPDVVAGRRAPAVQGLLTPDEALQQLLRDTSIAARSDGRVVTLKTRSLAISNLTQRADPLPERLMAEAVQTPAPASPSTTADPSGAASVEPQSVSAVVVTGTNIRGVRVSPSPVISITREAIDKSGFATVADALSALPQNFSGVSTPSTFLIGSDRLGTNTTAASGVNLRGLGANATLVLINGRRMAGSGLQGDFADVSAVPTAAVERVDLLLDGASALYGSDAVGGVVNIILRKTFEGLESRARLGGATEGGAFERQVGQTFGHVWSSGHLLASYEFYDQDKVRSADRAYTATADLRGLGGSDRRLFYSQPSNILLSDPKTGAFAPAYAIPLGQTGVGLTPSSFLPGQVNLANQRQGTDVLPNNRRESGYLAVTQDLGPRITLSGDARFSRRDVAFSAAQPFSNLSVSTKNPYFVSPIGAKSEILSYSFANELGPLPVTSSSESFGASLGADVDLGRGWQGEIYGASASEEGRLNQSHRLSSRFLSEALGNIADDPVTPFSTARDGFFNPFGAGGANSRAVLDFIGSGFAKRSQHSQTDSVSGKLDGPLFSLPGGEVKLAIGGQYRWEGFRDGGANLNSADVPVPFKDGPFTREVGAAFVEALVPLVGPANALWGVRALNLSLAARTEHYSDVGTTTNPKVGLVWDTGPDLGIRASYGTSFRAPSLVDVFSAFSAGPALLPKNGSNALVLAEFGGNLGLTPEKATSWTTTLDYHPSFIRGLKVEATFFDTDFTSRIGQPVNDDLANALSNPIYAAFVTPLSAANPADLAKVSALLALPTTANAGLFPASAYTAIVDVRYVNTGGLHVRGLDLTGSYGFDLGAHHFDVSGDASYLIDYDLKVTPAASPVSELNLPSQPIDLRLLATAAWSRGPYSAQATLRYTDSYKDSTGRRIDGFATADLQLRWTSPFSGGPLARLSLAATVQNLFDSDPPFYDNTLGVGYDPANASPLGRFVSIQLAKHW